MRYGSVVGQIGDGMEGCIQYPAHWSGATSFVEAVVDDSGGNVIFAAAC